MSSLHQLAIAGTCTVFSLLAIGCSPPSHKPHPAGTTYYIHPEIGDDTHSGTKPEKPWKTFTPVSAMNLTAGDQVKILAPGSFRQSLKITGTGTREAPISVHFAPGHYDFFPEGAIRRAYQISNTNSDPDTPKAIGILVDRAKHLQITGPDALIVYRGKMIEVVIDTSEDISIAGLSFDYHRPTVSEFQPVRVEKEFVEIEVHADSPYSVNNGSITWVGEGWSHRGGLGQALNLETDEIWRMRDPLKNLKFEKVGPRLLRGRGKHNLKMGHRYQVRDTFRDCAGVFTRRSKNISWKNIHFRFLHGMGLVSQFTENITYENVSIAPDPESDRTCAAWADGIHASGCRGKIVVKNCHFSGMQDDPINVHGTHLQVVERLSAKQVKVRFMHKQTFGFMAFNAGDQITFVHRDTLETFSPNRVESAELLSPNEMLLTLDGNIPDDVDESDAVENVTWTPEVHISGCTVRRTPTRGFLITTRRKAVVENNDFHRTRMSAILVENDAQGWYESGPVRDLTIRNNRFYHCAEPVIHIHPRNSAPNEAVHQKIRIESNHFALKKELAIKAKSTRGLKVANNVFYSSSSIDEKKAVQTERCSEVVVEDNQILRLEEFSE